MSSNVMKIKIPNFNEPSNDTDDDSYVSYAEIDGKEIGKFHFYFFDRFEFIEQTESHHDDFNFLARRLEFYELPYLNDDGIFVMAVKDFEFDMNYNDDYKIAFLSNTMNRIAKKLKNDIADIYAVVPKENMEVFKESNFEILEIDEEFGVFMHYHK